MKVNPKAVERMIRKIHIYGEVSLIKSKSREYSQKSKFEIIQKVLRGESKLSAVIEYNIEPS